VQVPAVFARQSRGEGQVPPHCGKGLCSHFGVSSTQSQRPAALGRQTVPVGQAPPHCGKGLWVQGGSSFTHSHWVEPGTDLQI